MKVDLTDEEYRVWVLFAGYRATHSNNLGINAAQSYLGSGRKEISATLKKLVDKNLLEYTEQWGYSVVGMQAFMAPLIFQYLEAKTTNINK